MEGYVMKNAKKALFKCLTLAMVATLSFGATGCSWFEKSEEKKEQEFIQALGGVSETYKGEVSASSYSTANSAAQAYVREQVVGEQSATIVNTTSQGTLSNEQVNALQLPAEVQDGIVSVEKMQVEYSTSATAYTSTNTQNKTVTVYVIKYATDWKYYTPAPITGETISKSYYDSVFNHEKYENCTFTNTMTINMTLAMVINVKVILTQTVKHENGKLYMEQTTAFSGLGEEESDYLALYIEETGSSAQCYAKTAQEGSWSSATLHQVGYNSIEELRPFYNDYLDYSYFTKTEYGFRMADENAKKYIQETLAKEESIKEFFEESNSLDMDLFIKYYVSEGVLSGIRQDASFDLNINLEEEGAITVKVELTNKTLCTNYGTTTIERPNIG